MFRWGTVAQYGHSNITSDAFKSVQIWMTRIVECYGHVTVQAVLVFLKMISQVLFHGIGYFSGCNMLFHY